MMTAALPQRLAAEALGTGLLVATVVGSGIMAESLTKDVALALLGNTLPTGAMLVVLITILGPISGAHFNPAVSLIFALKRDLAAREAAFYVSAQVAGGVLGTIAAHMMFALPLLDRFHEGAHRRRAMVRRMGRYLRPSRHNPCRYPLRTRGRAVAGRALHHRRLLVHGFNLFCQPRRRYRTGLHQYLFGHPTYRPARLHHCATAGGAMRACLCGLAPARGRRRGRTLESRGAIMTVTIYHNPDCGTSRNTLAMIRQSGEDPVIIEYLKTPPTRARLQELIAAMGISVRALLREKGTPYAELGLADPKWTATSCWIL